MAMVLPSPAAAQDAVWLGNPGQFDFNTGANWSTGAVPLGTAFFGVSAALAPTVATPTSIGGWTFTLGASVYIFQNTSELTFTGAGILVHGGNAHLTNRGDLYFTNASTAGSAIIVNNSGGTAFFLDRSSAGSAAIFNNTAVIFDGTSTAASAAITNSHVLLFNGASSAGSATITSSAITQFSDTSSAGNATIVSSHGSLTFTNASTAGSANITNDDVILQFDTTSSAGNATITNTNVGTVMFINNSTAASARITNNAGSSLAFYEASTAGSAVIANNANMGFNGVSSAASSSIVNSGTLSFNDTSAAGNAAITNNGDLGFRDASTAGGSSITNTNALHFDNTSTAGTAVIANNANMGFNGSSSAASSSIVNSSTLTFHDTSAAGNAAITNNGDLGFRDASTAAGSSITNTNALHFDNTSTAGNASIINGNGTLNFLGSSTAGNASITNNGSGRTQFLNNATGGAAQFVNSAGGVIDFSGSTGLNSDGNLAAGSIAGGGRVFLGANTVTVGGNNLSSTISGVISDCGSGADCIAPSAGGSLVKDGTGTLTLSGINTYTGPTEVKTGTLLVNGAIAAGSFTLVDAGATLGGTGLVGGIVLDTGATLAPGTTTVIGTLTADNTVIFCNCSIYSVKIFGATSDKVQVNATANLDGAVQVKPLGRVTATTTYTILSSTAPLSGEFTSVGIVGAALARNARLSYVGNDVLLTVDPGLLSPILQGANQNQRNVATTIDNALIAGANTPAGFDALFSLSGAPLNAALGQASGETATGSQQTTFQAMTQFMTLMTDPFSAGRGFDAPGAMGFAEEGDATDSATVRKRSGSERDAFGMMARAAPRAATFEARWNVWAAGFGGSQTTDGNVALGSNRSTSRVYGVAAGADYWLSPATVAGFALAGGGTSFSVAAGGSGRSDLFQAGAFIRHMVGSAYVIATAAYGWQDITTDRRVTIAGADQLHARFNANSFAGRFEAGNRFVIPWLGGMGAIPYAAAQVTNIVLPAYAESVVSGANTFALSYASKTVTAPRSELGLRTDKSYAVGDALLTLRGRAAWAHDFNTDRAASATFQALPGGSFVVNGAAAAHDAALATASAEMKFISGISLAVTFEGEFSEVTRSYAGKGVVRYIW
jgi:autotransporter-associated beta strand protein